MNKIVHFFRNFVYIPIGIGILAAILFVFNHKMLAMWLAHIWLVVYFMPIAYELTGSLNLTLCCNSLKNNEKEKWFQKKIKLNVFWKKFFCGYDESGNMTWLPLCYQSLFLLYVVIFLLLNFLFITTILTNIHLQISWINVWFIEITFQLSLFAIAILSAYIKNIYLWTKDRKEKHSNLDSESIIKRDIKTLKQKRIIKQKNKIINLLKPLGMYVDRKHHYFILSSNTEKAISTLSKEYPQLPIIISSKQKNDQAIEIYDTKHEYLLIQINIIDL